jgi:methyl-accepting chemotaxis protein
MMKTPVIMLALAAGLGAAHAAPDRSEKQRDKEQAETEKAAQAAGDAAAEAQAAQEREVRGAAEQLAKDAAQAMEQWIASQATTEDRLFARLYFPVAKTSPQKYTTQYDALAERDLVGLEDKALLRNSSFQYAIVTDGNGYIPAHNTRFAQPLTGNPTQDYAGNRTKRMLGDTASLIAARSEAHYTILRTKLETGDVIYDLSVPIRVRGKHWGCARIGYKRSELPSTP